MLYAGGSYGSLAYGSRRTAPLTTPTETTIVSGKPAVVLSSKTQTAVLPTRDDRTVLTGRSDRTILGTRPDLTILDSTQDNDDVLL